MTIEKLPSGSYRVRQQIDGRRYTIILPYKPSKKEAARLIDDKRTGRDKLKLTFDAAAVQYIDGKRNTLSPSTVRGYESLRKNIPAEFKDMLIGEITGWEVQKYINNLSDVHSPKTVRNVHSFISAVLNAFRPDLVLHTKLPQRTKREIHLPTDEEINRIFEAVAGTEYDVPFRLAAYGLRRSEICALTSADLEGDVLTINKALVEDEHKNWVIKTTKTVESTRQIVLDPDLCAKIRLCDRIFDGHPGKLYKGLQSILNRLDIEHFSFHTLRHYYASTAHAIGIPDAVIMASGGWRTDHVMKNIYRHEKKAQVEEMQRKYASQFHDHI